MTLRQQAIQEYLDEHYPGYVIIKTKFKCTYLIRPTTNTTPDQEVYVYQVHVTYFHHNPKTGTLYHIILDYTEHNILQQITHAINNTYKQ